MVSCFALSPATVYGRLTPWTCRRIEPVEQPLSHSGLQQVVQSSLVGLSRLSRLPMERCGLASVGLGICQPAGQLRDAAGDDSGGRT